MAALVRGSESISTCNSWQWNRGRVMAGPQQPCQRKRDKWANPEEWQTCGKRCRGHLIAT